MTQLLSHMGSCHCGAVAFEVDAPAVIKVSDCNCSICRRSGYLHLIVSRDRFRLLRGEEHLQTYTFDTHEAKHLFCKICGIKSYYIPRSHPQGISVNARCLDQRLIHTMHIEPFDGQNWEQNIGTLHRSLDQD